jgi:transposase-like protein
MFLTCGFVLSYEAVQEWEATLAPALAGNLRRKRKGRVGPSWYVNETYIRVCGQWRHLYCAIDRDGALVDVMLSEHRGLAAQGFLRSAKTVTGATPDRVTTDRHDPYPRGSELNSAGRCGIGRTATSTTDSSRTTVASKADVEPCWD